MVQQFVWVIEDWSESTIIAGSGTVVLDWLVRESSGRAEGLPNISI
jgi:hypothetical protein